jgi:hypothetical protein
VAVDLDLVALAHHRAHAGGDAVDGDAARGDQPVCFAPGTETGFGDVLVEAGDWRAHPSWRSLTRLRWTLAVQLARRTGLEARRLATRARAGPA